ncbi:hypothetical protein GUJ93_ZPchr0006g43720 [Zizania palustris]|uniref:DUF834 domain-containing protein n=1 Tax=Zizania palustris TaxID=103762 RepID=A0A8J5VS38_ZIZPA|nr:hypothetical protein GUJ93_ZPchr0006g43720 [Zizania palustris]
MVTMGQWWRSTTRVDGGALRVLDGDGDPMAPTANGVDAGDGRAPAVMMVATTWTVAACDDGVKRVPSERLGVVGAWPTTSEGGGGVQVLVGGGVLAGFVGDEVMDEVRMAPTVIVVRSSRTQGDSGTVSGGWTRVWPGV